MNSSSDKRQTVSRDEARKKIKNRSDLHLATLRNDDLVPLRFSDPMNTLKFLKGLQDKTYWTINASKTKKIFTCADPPSKKTLAKILSKEMFAYQKASSLAELHAIKRTAMQIRKKNPCVDWQLQLLG